MNQFKGHVHPGKIRIGSKKQNVFLPAREYTQIEGSQALAYVRPYDIDLHRYSPEDEWIVAELQRAVVVGPVASMELIDEVVCEEANGQLIDAQIPASLFHQQRFWRFSKSNGITEGFHTKMEMMSRRAYGFRNFENYRMRVLAHCGWNGVFNRV